MENRNNIKTRKELKEDIEKEWKGEQDYFDWYDRVDDSKNPEDKLCLEPFPHRPFYTYEEKLEDYNLRDRQRLSYTFFPWPEELKPRELKAIERERRHGCPFLIAPWVPEDKEVEIWHPIFAGLMHYSTDPKVWEWDWQANIDSLPVGFNYDLGTGFLDFFMEIKNRDLLYLAEKIIRENKIQVKIVNNIKFSEGEFLRVRLNRKKYKIFRKILLELSKKGLYTVYDYEEIRNLLKDSSSYLIA